MTDFPLQQLNYARYFLPELFPNLHGRFVFLDDDVIVQGTVPERSRTVNVGARYVPLPAPQLWPQLYSLLLVNLDIYHRRIRLARRLFVRATLIRYGRSSFSSVPFMSEICHVL